ncbi:MAG: anaerobic ribonucleoside-triphosphate reductase activating protein [Oscillospiraceae bacterium]|nr:anaerobic ribonucleoside-triphosphate reductase activating protein [Oscillospiraceae bacterium]
MKIAGLVHDSIVDGPGIRYVVYTQGCSLCCLGCHNPQTWDFDGGNEISVEKIINDMLTNPLTDGLTLSGGEPFEQAADCISLAAVARERGLNVWVYTGKTFEEIFAEAKQKTDAYKLLSLTDVLIDGRYIAKERTLALKWRGSKNQRLIDVQKSLKTGNGEMLNENNC